MEVDMNSFEIISHTMDQFSVLWRIKCAQPDVSNPVLDKELKFLEEKLHVMGVNTDSLKI